MATPPHPPASREAVTMERMVGWFELPQLVRTGIEVLISTIFSRHSDFRLRYTGPAPTTFFDYSRVDPVNPESAERKSIWIDYVADLADGWNSTYSVAYELSKPALTLDGYETKRGDILIFGGDNVYPIPNRKEYRTRLIAPYKAALPEAEPAPHLFAIPGNHDWYDSLVSFTRLFCAKRKIGAWQTQQDRSYFALKLPHHWWLVGTDVQLVSDIDEQQVKYFQAVAAEMGPQDRVILCQAEPLWVYAGMYEGMDEEFNENNLRFLEHTVFKDRIVVFIAGDLHHYRRHANDRGQHKITAGGGGAFLHPTHEKHVDELAGGYRVQTSFPDRATSRRLTWRNLLFAWHNPSFGILPAIAYVLLSWTFRREFGHYALADWEKALASVLLLTVLSPMPFLLVAGIVLGFVLFTDTHSRLYRWLGGGAHALAHLTAAFICGWTAAELARGLLRIENVFLHSFVVGALVLAGGWVVGSTIMGIYLLISMNLFGRHGRESFSALRIEDWKAFLRLHVDEAGKLTIFPVGLRRVCKRWKEDTGAPRFVPDGDESQLLLIEGPLRIGGGRVRSNTLR